MAGGQCWCKMSITLDTDAILDFLIQMVNQYEENSFYNTLDVIFRGFTPLLYEKSEQK